MKTYDYINRVVVELSRQMSFCKDLIVEPLQLGREGEGRKGEEEKERGGVPPSLVQFGLPIGRGRDYHLWDASSLPYGP